jgi:pimeloyl-ACP methyl ester carboxylesterase
MLIGPHDAVIQQPTAEFNQLQRTANTRHYLALDGCNHFPMLEQTAKFNRLLIDFIHADKGSVEIAPKEHWQRRTR